MKALMTMSMLLGLTIADTIPAMADPHFGEITIESRVGRNGGVDRDIHFDTEIVSMQLKGAVDRSGDGVPLIRNDMDLCVEPVDGDCPDF